MSNKNLEGRTALVTGAARGIGAGITQALATAGAAVVIGDIREVEGKATAVALAEAGHHVSFVRLDVSSDDSWRDATEATISQFGGFDILVNNAGVFELTLLTEIDPDRMANLLKVNVVGTALGHKHALRVMRPGGAVGRGGAIVNISSVATLTTTPGMAAYSASKAAVDRLTRVAAAEAGRLGYGVRVNCIYPGHVATEMGDAVMDGLVNVGLAPDKEAAYAEIMSMTPLGRSAEVDDIAEAVVFLASDSAKYITGIGLPVTGGMGS